MARALSPLFVLFLTVFIDLAGFGIIAAIYFIGALLAFGVKKPGGYTPLKPFQLDPACGCTR